MSNFSMTANIPADVACLIYTSGSTDAEVVVPGKTLLDGAHQHQAI